MSTQQPFAARQNEIYLAGVSTGERPSIPVSIAELESRAKEAMSDELDLTWALAGCRDLEEIDSSRLVRQA